MMKTVQYHIESWFTRTELMEHVNRYLEANSGWDVEGPVTYINTLAQFPSQCPNYEYHQVLVRRVKDSGHGYAVDPT